MKEVQQQIRQGIRELEILVGKLEAWQEKYAYYDTSDRGGTAKHAFYMLLKELRESVDLY